MLNLTVKSIFFLLLKIGLSPSTTKRSGNPGYLPGVPLIAGNLAGSAIK